MNKLKNIIIIILIIIFTISVVPRSFQNDTFFTIAKGNDVLENGVQKEEKLVWHEGLEYTNSRWLFDTIIATIYNNFNFIGVYILVLIIAVFQALIYNYILNKIIKRKEISCLFTLITIYFVSNEFAARAQIISFLLFLIEFYCIEQLVKTNKNLYFIILIFVPFILVNIHASVFPVYFVFYLPYIAEFILSKIQLKNKTENKIIVENISIKKLLILVIIGVIMSFCTPEGVSPYTDMFKAMGGLSAEFIDELQPLDIFDEIYFSVLSIIAIAILGFTKTKIRLTDSLYILGFGIMALSTYRCVFFFYLISSICIYRLVNDFINIYEISIKDKYIKNTIETVIIIFIVIFSVQKFTYNLTHEYADITVYPVEIADYIVNNLDIDNMRIYNNFHMGGYLEFKGIKVFIDSRSRNLYSRI